MHYNFQTRVSSTRPSLIREFSGNVSRYDDAVDLTLGEPDFDTPERIRQAGIRAIEENRTRYTEDDGLRELRVAACAYFKREYELNYDPDWEMMVTCGATEALDAAFRSVLGPGDEILVPSPVYLGYEPLIRFCGAVPVYVDTSANHFVLTPAMLEEACTSYTRALLLNYPNNPTGKVLSEGEMQALADWLSRHPDIMIISDEVYAGLTYHRRHISIAALNDLWNRTIVINGLSKSYAMTGWRIGFLAAPRRISDELYKVHQNTVSCASSISQYAAVEALKSSEETVMMRHAYEERAEYLIEAFKALDIPVSMPGGAFYLFPDISQFGLSSLGFATLLLQKYHVGVVPGSAFGSSGEGCIRISYAASMEQLKVFVRRLHRCISSLTGE
jgi:aspartate/methionine/tyrosine aminotransferase